jgi:hypothetical protein
VEPHQIILVETRQPLPYVLDEGLHYPELEIA